MITNNAFDPGDLKALFKVPTYDGNTSEWTHTFFYTIEEFREFVKSTFKEPGKYNLDATSSAIFNEQAKIFKGRKFYCDAPFKSRDYIEYWDTHKERCRRGVIVKGTKGQVWYLSRDYYMWLNYLPIMNKEKQGVLGSDDTETFPDIRDAQYHMALYEVLAELHYEHAAVLKKRQIASSLFHASKIINQIWFEKGVTCKMGASDWEFIGEEGTWKMLNQYRSFLNEHTAWYRPFKPEGVGMWTQQIEETRNGRKTMTGLLSNLLGITLDKSPTKGVGGAVKYFFYEEGGIAPTADKTYEYIRPALQSGLVTVGMFIIAGSVGDLKQCNPLKEFLLNPKANGFYAVETNLVNDKGEVRMCALFIPEQWSMQPFIDEHGNSDVEGALAAILAEREQWKADGLAPDQYQLRVSQKPINIEEAFAYREESPFPQHLVTKQLQRISDGHYPMEYVDLSRNDVGKVVAKKSNKLPIKEFPIPKAQVNKEGCVVIYERPDKDLKPYQSYYASIDPVHDGKTTTSRSLCSIIIYKNPVQVTKELTDGSKETFYEGDKIVAEWTGRFDDIDKTHELLEMLIEYYMAWALVEANGSFFTYMTGKNKTHFLVPSNQMIYNKELKSQYSPNHTYGWKNTGTVFKSYILPYGIDFMKRELDSTELPNGERIITKYGVERIPSEMILKEAQVYRDGVNVDRLVAYCALVAFADIQLANRGIVRRTETRTVKKEGDDERYKVSSVPFRHMGKSSTTSTNSPKRSAFKNMR